MRRWTVEPMSGAVLSRNRWRVVLSGETPPRADGVLAPEDDLIEAREALRELYGAVRGSSWNSRKNRGGLSVREQAAMARAKQVLGIPETCDKCGQEIGQKIWETGA